MLVSDFDYELPPDCIAQEPLPDRASSRMLHLLRANPERPGGRQDRAFRDFPDLLRPDDLVVLNNTRVFPARLYAHRSGQRAQSVSPRNAAARDFLRGMVEVLLTQQVSDHPNVWNCLVRPGRKIGVGEKLFFVGPGPSVADSDKTSARTGHPDAPVPAGLEAEVIARGDFGQRTIRFGPVADFFARVDEIGHVPLPPYIRRDDRSADRDRYQTIYARTRGSIAAPTAGLHFTPDVLGRIRARGIEIAEITLHVGLGTFQPVRVETVEDHKLHRESYEISVPVANAINSAKASGRRVVAIGTTTVRTLEFAARLPAHAVDRDNRNANSLAKSHTFEPASVQPGRGEADIFIYPGYRFRITEALLTNFHLPQSTLLMLVCALGERQVVLEAYRHAVKAGYRFYSYGDCMFIE